MTEVFLKILNTSISASWLILVVILLRFLFRKAPKNFRCWLWLVVAVRLIFNSFPVSGLSLIPNSKTIPENIATARIPTIDSGVEVIDKIVNPMLLSGFASDPANSANPLQVISAITSVVWLVGVICMILFFVASYVKLKKSVSVSVKLQDNIWICDTIQSPFILGLFLPKMYIPSDVKQDELSYIIAHEEQHLKHHDTWWKPFGYFILTIHWFNPLVWIAYTLMCKDIELACDERVIWTLDGVEKKRYSEVLLTFGELKQLSISCPVAFGEIGVKQRIKSIVNFKKPSGWIVATFIVAMLGLGICFMTNPLGGEDLPKTGPGPSKDDEPAVEIMNAFEKLYESDFIYRQETLGAEMDGMLPSLQVLTGKYDEEFEVEHLVHVSGQKDWSEMYRYEENGVSLVKMLNGDTWTEMKMDKAYFYGYGCDLTLDTAHRGMSVEKDLTVIYDYKTYYTMDIGAMYDLPVELIATIHQDIAVEEETGLIRSISTDVHELYKKLMIANQMTLHNISYDEAVVMVEENKEANIPEYIYVEIVYEDVDFSVTKVFYPE